MSHPSFTLAIIGRPNVGKSTLFNRLYGRRRALVHDEAGVTRDRLVEVTRWWVQGQDLKVELIDTGGLGGDRFSAEIEEQVKIALTEAQVVLVLMDSQAGLTALDREVTLRMKRSGLLQAKDKVVIGVVNKVDDEKHEERISDFFSAGLDPILTISAEHGRGIDDLKEKIFEMATERDLIRVVEVPVESTATDPDGETDDSMDEGRFETEAHRAIPRIAIVGRPNVGKSTMVNALVGKKRMIESPIAGTTVDSVDSLVKLGDQSFILIDTAGIRRKSKTEKGIEVLSVVQARKALERCDVAVLLLDGEHGITDQDAKIGSLIEEVGCGVILAVNKWDTQRKNPKFTREMAADVIRKEMAYLRYAPIMFTSAKERKGFQDLGELANDILTQRELKVSTREFSEFVRREAEVHNPMDAKFYLCHQSGRHPPTFVCHVNNPDKVHFSTRRHILNALREKWGFMGNPVRLLFIEGKSDRKASPKKARESYGRRERSERNRQSGRD